MPSVCAPTRSDPSGQTIRMRGAPLDFLAVTDHAEYLGNITALGDPGHPLAGSELTEVVRGVMVAAFTRFGAALRTGEAEPLLHDDRIRADAWQRIAAAAERHNDPGTFTTFVGYEYSSAPDGMLHRNVVFRGARVPKLPFGAADSLDPEDLWAWLDGLRGKDIEALSIPRNTNLSSGNFFLTTTFEGESMDIPRHGRPGGVRAMAHPRSSECPPTVRGNVLQTQRSVVTKIHRCGPLEHAVRGCLGPRKRLF